MIEVAGDLFKPPKDVGAICITTNGATRKDGAAIMGRGVALQATKIWPGVEWILGSRIKNNGNKTQFISETEPGGNIVILTHDEWHSPGFHVFSLPVKHHWKKRADVELIEASLLELVRLSSQVKGKIALPRPGCGNGGLSWGEVQFLVRRILSTDQFLVMEKFQ